MENKEGQRLKSPLFTIIGVLAVIGIIAAGAYLFLQKGAIKKGISDLEKETQSIQKSIDKIDIEKLQTNKKAQDILKVIEASEITWSNVISKVQDLIPLDENGEQTILFNSYSGSEDGTISMSATSRPDHGSESAKQAFKDVAELLSVFNNSNIFINGFVPSIAKGLSEDGSVVLSFSFSADYSPKINKRKTN